MLALLAALGSGPACLLRYRFEAAVCGCFAPVLGLCLGTALFTTLEWFWSGQTLGWLVPVAAVLSLGFGQVVVHRPRRSAKHLRSAQTTGVTSSLRLGAHVCLILIAVSAPFALALADHASTGPVSYDVYDSTAYVAETDALQVQSIRTAETDHDPSNLVTRFFDGYAGSVQEFDYSPLSAALNALVGLHSSDTQSPFLLSVLVAGALAMYGSIRQTLRRASWVACLGGLLFGGSFFLQLYFDGSEAALAGLAILVPFLVIGYETVADGRLRELFVTALLAQGLLAFYPTMDVTIGIALALYLLTAGVVGLHGRGRAALGGEALVLLRVLGLCALAAVLNVVAFRRDLAYWRSLLHGGFVEPNFPQMHIAVPAIAGWVLQTRGLYSFAFSSQGALTDFLPALLVPVVLALFAVPALRRRPVTWLVFILLPVALGLGGYQVAHNACGYCEDRSLLPVTPAVVYLVTVGLGLLAMNAKTLLRLLSVGGAALLAAMAALSAYRSYGEFSDGSYFLTSSVRSVLSALPSRHATVLLEGFGEGPKAPAEEAFVYELAEERYPGHVSLVADEDDRFGLAYLGTAPLEPPIYLPGYNFVLTRIPGVDSGLTVVARQPGIALERRPRGPNVSVDSGLAVSLMPSGDPEGEAWVIGPVRLVVSEAGDRRTYVRAEFALPAPSTAVPPAPGVVFTRAGAGLAACAAAGPDGVADVATIPLPTAAIRIVSISASHAPCR